MFYNVMFCLEILSTYMTSILIPHDYPCGKEISDNVYEMVHMVQIVKSQIQPMGAVKTMQALLSVVVRL